MFPLDASGISSAFLNQIINVGLLCAKAKRSDSVFNKHHPGNLS